MRDEAALCQKKYQRRGIGRILNETVVKKARQLGFKRILLDTNAEMINAVELYRKAGFNKIDAYCENENTNVIYFEFLL